MRRLIVTVIIVLTVFLYTGCPDERHRTIVFVIDMSASTDAVGRAKAFQAVSGWFAQKKLKRGDKIIVIPITGDAWTESQGLIQRFEISEKREAYDADLRRLETEMKQQLENMERAAAEKPYKKTDIFGALRLAAEELAHESKKTKKTIVVLSDLIQDNAVDNFKAAVFLENQNAAMKQAQYAAQEQSNDFTDCTVFLGLLRSNDLKSLSPKRREALEAFWVTYFRFERATEVITSIDGPGQVDLVLTKSE